MARYQLACNDKSPLFRVFFCGLNKSSGSA